VAMNGEREDWRGGIVVNVGEEEVDFDGGIVVVDFIDESSSSQAWTGDRLLK